LVRGQYLIQAKQSGEHKDEPVDPDSEPVPEPVLTGSGKEKLKEQTSSDAEVKNIVNADVEEADDADADDADAADDVEDESVVPNVDVDPGNDDKPDKTSGERSSAETSPGG
jgi:hypothetical protein